MEANKKIAVVTGGNKGIGLEICKQLASNGIYVILTARDEKRGNEAAEKLTRDYNLANIMFQRLDVTDHSSIVSLAGFIEKRFGKLDILINNAAVGGFEFTKSIDEKLSQRERLEFFIDNVIESYEKAVDCYKTNYYGVKDMMEVFLPLIKLSDRGKIVNVSGLAGQLTRLNNENLRRELDDVDNLTEQRIDDLATSFLKYSFKDNILSQENKWTSQFNSYSSTKILMNAYTRVFARDNPGVSVNCVHPGHIKTDANFHTGFLTVSDGAKGPVMVALDEAGTTGQFYDQTQISTFY